MIETPFPDAVTVAHAVPFVHVPPGSRRQETRLVRIGTRAAIPRCADGDMRAVSATIGGDPLHVDPDGGLWARLRVPVPGKRAQPLSPAGFLSFLRGEADAGFEQAILRSLTRTPLSPRTLGAIRAHVDAVETCSEDAIVRAMRMLWERAKVVVEPSAAVPLACLLEDRFPAKGKRIGVILSGGNVDLDKLPWQ